ILFVDYFDRRAAAAPGIGLLDDEIAAFHRQYTTLFAGVVQEVYHRHDDQRVPLPGCPGDLFSLLTVARHGVLALRPVEFVCERTCLATTRDREHLGVLFHGELGTEPWLEARSAGATSAAAVGGCVFSRWYWIDRHPLAREIRLGLRTQVKTRGQDHGRCC